MHKTLVGTQILPEPLYREGIEDTLDRMRELSEINTLFVMFDTTYLRSFRGANVDAASGKEITEIWVHTHSQYHNRSPFPYAQNPDALYGDRDILDELTEPAAARDMAVYARVLEPYYLTDAVPGISAALQIDAYDKPLRTICPANPEYIAWWDGITEDLIRSHSGIAGLKFGQERGGPLCNLLLGNGALCFCEHCRRRAREQGIDVDRAMRGMRELDRFVQDVRGGEGRPRDGYFVTMLRLFMRFPEILAWDSLWFKAREDQKRRIYGQVKAIAPRMQVGWHMVHGVTYDPLMRAQIDYEDIASYSDFIKPVVYFDCAAMRGSGHFSRGMGATLLGDLPTDDAYAAFLRICGLNPATEPDYATLADDRLPASADYVFREMKRCVDAVGSKAKVYAGAGFDVPTQKVRATPDQVRKATSAVFAAGADGIVLPREWHEASEENLRAAGDAIRELFGTTTESLSVAGKTGTRG